MPELKKRAYLARFLVKIELAPEVEGDQEVMALYNQYERSIEEFKVAHANAEMAKKSISSVQEIQKDIKSMEEEKEQVLRKLEQIKRRVDPDTNRQMFDLLSKFVREKAKADKNRQMLHQQQEELKYISAKLDRVTTQLRDVQNTHQPGTTPG